MTEYSKTEAPAIELPIVEVSQISTDDGVNEAVSLFAEAGCLLVRNVYSASYLEKLRISLERRERGLFRSRNNLSVGDKRTMITVAVKQEWSQPDLYANEILLPILKKLLGKNLILGSLVAVNAKPGAELQHIHRDHAPLYEVQMANESGEIDKVDDTPTFAITVLIPLVEQNSNTGNTRVWPESHRLLVTSPENHPAGCDYIAKVGDCLLMDYRLLHAGRENKSQLDRPILTMVYYRWWFRDSINYNFQRALNVSYLERRKIPAEFRNLFSGMRLNPSLLRRVVFGLRKYLNNRT